MTTQSSLSAGFEGDYMSKIDLTGQRFNKLTVIGEAGRAKNGSIIWACRCDCGTITSVRTTSLRNGATKSCGCFQKAQVKKSNLTHGMTQQKVNENRIPRIYRTWANMKTRCNNPNTKYYNHWGGRGIKVCEEWAESFEAFFSWAMANGYQDDLQIDRIDNDGDYEPGNCRWVDSDQNANNKRSSLIIEYQGERHTAAEWARITGISQKAIYTRHKAGKSPKEILRK